MSRNASGTYSLPNAAVQTGTPIDPAWANSTLDDIALEITNSVARDGSGAMSAPLKLDNGTEDNPALAFGSDPDVGLYRKGANNPALSAGGSKIQEWTTAGSSIVGTLSVSGALTVAGVTGALPVTGALSSTAGLTVTQSVANTNGVTATGNGTGRGGVFTGGADADGVVGTGNGSGRTGVVGVGGAAGAGGSFNGGTGNSNALLAQASGTGSGLVAAAPGTGYGVQGTSASGAGVRGVATGAGSGVIGECSAGGAGGTFASTSGVALSVGAGHAHFTGGNPASNAGFTNKLTPMNLIKAWAHVEIITGTPAVAAGFNITGVTLPGGNTIRVTFVDDMADTVYGVVTSTGRNSSATVVVSNPQQGYVDLTASADPAAAPAVRFTLVILGAQ